MTIKPIFVFSISRTGSTLVQRVIAAHDGVATASEPWLLLPYLYAFKREGVIADYVHPLLVTAVEDFCEQLPGGRAAYDHELHDHVLRLYRRAAGDEARYFVDKSPPYYHVAEDILRLFPEGRFVFLWRNPLSTIASILETWDHARWRPTMFHGDLFVGLPKLVSVCRAAGDAVHSVRFEDLIGGDERHWGSLMSYLGIPFEPTALERFSEVALAGRMGDPTGVKRYDRLTTDRAGRSTRALANPLRKAWCRRYLRFLGDDRLAAMGYDGDRLRRELDAQPTSAASLAPDIGRLVLDVAAEPLRARLRRRGVGGPNVLRELLRG